MSLKITDPVKQVAVLNRWADDIESRLTENKTATSRLNSVTQTQASSPPNVNIGLDMPQEFTVTPPRVGPNGTFDVEWAPEPPLEVLLTNTTTGGGLVDSFDSTGGSSSDPVNLDLSTHGDKEVVVVCWASDGGSPSLGAPYTTWSNSGVASVNATYRATKGKFALVTGSGGSDFSILGISLGASSIPTVVQSASATASNGASLICTLPHDTIKGNHLLCFLSIHNISGTARGFAGLPTDTQSKVFSQFTAGASPAQTVGYVWITDSLIGGPEAVNSNWTATFPTGSVAAQFQVFELSNLGPATVLPHFASLTKEFIPPISLDLADMGNNGGVTGLLDHSAIAPTTVTPGSYTSANITVQADGTITAASNGSGGGGVSSLNALTGALSITSSGGSLTVTPSGTTIDLAVNGGGSVGAIGRKVVNTSSYAQLSGDSGKILDVQTSSATTITLAGAGISTITKVQSKNSGAGSSVFNLTFTNPTTNGNTITLTARLTTGSGTPAISDSQGNIYTPRQTIVNGSSSNITWDSIGITGGTCTVSIGSGFTFSEMLIVEWSGIGSFDQASGNSQGTGTTATSLALTPTNSDSLLMGWVSNETANGLTISPGGSFTTVDTSNGNVSVASELLTIPASTTVSFGLSSSVNWSCGLLVYAPTITGTLFSGWIQNNSLFLTTVALTTGLINGLSSLLLYPGQGCTIGTDNSNFTAELGSWRPTLRSKSATYTAIQGDYILGNTTSAGFTITLPAASTVPGAIITVTKVSSDANNLTVSRAGSDLIVGATTAVISVQYNSITLLSDGSSNWFIL